MLSLLFSYDKTNLFPSFDITFKKKLNLTRTVVKMTKYFLFNVVLSWRQNKYNIDTWRRIHSQCLRKNNRLLDFLAIVLSNVALEASYI